MADELQTAMGREFALCPFGEIRLLFTTST